MPFGVNLLRSPALYWAAQGLLSLYTLPASAAVQAEWTDSPYAMHSERDYGMFIEQAVSSQGFLWLLAAVLCVSQACLQQCSRVRAVLEEGLKAGRTPRTQWGLLLQDMQEAGQAVSEVAHGRWAKLLGSRSAEYLQYCEDSFLPRCLDINWQACIS